MKAKKINRVLIFALALVVLLSTCAVAYAKGAEVYPMAMSSEEIKNFLQSAEPAPIPVKTRTIYTQDHVGSYTYDMERQITEFEDLVIPESESAGQSSPGYFPEGFDTMPQPFGIVGDDNRVKVTNTTDGQWRNTVKLLIKGRDNKNYIGSGFMIGPNSVATSGHCVYNTSWNGWAKEITVIPALKGTSQPYGSAVSYKLECGGNWLNNNDNQDDWGIIRIKANLGNSTGWLGLRWQSASYNGETVRAVGYPGEDGTYMYYGDGKVNSSSKRTLSGNWDISGGQSGGPVQKYYSSTGYTAIGINRGGSSTYSDCLRIDEWVYNKLISYRDLSY